MKCNWSLAVTALTALAWAASAAPIDRVDEPLFHTFSIAAVDPATGESGVAVTTRVSCVGNAVPWVRAGVGAVATQAWTRLEYGDELLDALGRGESPAAALVAALATDERATRRQVGVIALNGQSAQHTGSETQAWAGHRAGANYATQGNILVGPEVLAAVAESFESTAGSQRHLADRLIEALAAGQAIGGDRRKGRLQSAAVLVADPRDEQAQRPDKVSTNINVCEHSSPVAELRRIYDTITETLGYRTLEQQRGGDVWQLKVILHALGLYRADQAALERDDDAFFYDEQAVAAVEAFRKAEGLSIGENGSPRGLVDAAVIERLWLALEKAGKAAGVGALLGPLLALHR